MTFSLPRSSGLGMCSFTLQPGEEKIIGERVVQLFHAHSA
jgi:hypothetical protein